MSDTIERVEVLVNSPTRNYVTLRAHHRRRDRRARRRHGQRTRAGCRGIPAKPRRAPAHRSRPRPDRGHLAVPVPRGLLASRPDHHGRHRGRRHGALGHPRQAHRPTGLPAARGAGPRPHPDLPARVRLGRPLAARVGRPPPGRRLHERAHPDRRARSGHRLRRDPRGVVRAGRARERSHRGDLGHRRLPALLPHRRRAGPRPRGRRDQPAARRAPPPDPDAGRASWANGWSRSTCTGSRT